MFAFISVNWRGHPLVNYETVVNLIARTTARTGLRVATRLDMRTHNPGVKISDHMMAHLQITSPRDAPPVELYHSSKTTRRRLNFIVQ
jgi:hypothetical protein